MSEGRKMIKQIKAGKTQMMLDQHLMQSTCMSDIRVQQAYICGCDVIFFFFMFLKQHSIT